MRFSKTDHILGHKTSIHNIRISTTCVLITHGSQEKEDTNICEPPCGCWKLKIIIGKEIISRILPNYNAAKLLINKRNYREYTNSWKRNNTLLNGDWVKKKTNREILKFLELTENET